MGSFREEYEKRLRRLCGVTDDTLQVTENSETVYVGYCDTCSYEKQVIEVTVYGPWKAGKPREVKGRREFDDFSQMIRELDEVEL